MTRERIILSFVLVLLAIVMIGLLGGLERRIYEVEDTIQAMGEDAYYDIHAHLEDSLRRAPRRREIAEYYLTNYNYYGRKKN
jgi:hypothetical protein